MRDDFRKDLWIVLTAASIGALFGAIHNSLDAGISPEFYRVIKHAPPNVTPGVWAVYIGITRGFVLGLLLGAGFCFASDSGSAPAMSYRNLLPWMVLPILFSAAGSVVCAAVSFPYNTPGASGLPLHIRRNVEQVGTMHTGVYMGGGLGTAVAIRGIRKKRTRLPGVK